METKQPTAEAAIIAAMRQHADPVIRQAAEKLARVKGWKAEDAREVLREMLTECCNKSQ
jgi:hypothetical protein